MRHLFRASSIHSMRSFSPLIGLNGRGQTTSTQGSRRRAAILGAVWVTLIVGSGCQAPKPDSCALTCEVEKDQCPDGLVCRTGFCVDKSFEGACGSSGGTSAGGSSAEAGAGGQTTTEPSNVGGSSETGGTSSLGGSGGTSSIGGESSSGGATVGSTTVGGSSAATGGVGTTLGTAGTGGTVSEGGSSSTGGTQSGVGGTSGQGTVVVPSITTETLKVRCLGEVVDEPLTATGCSASELEWKATIPDGLGITLSASGNLSGVLKKKGSYTIEVNVRNKVTNSAYATKNLTLTVNGESSTACPTIKVKGQLSAALAPAACEKWDYSAEFEVTGGSPLYAWTAINPPAGLTFDALSYVLSGHPTAGGTTTLRVTDGTGRIIQRDFEIPLRKKCWFGYISDQTGANRMHLFDPLLKTRLDRPTSNDASLSVADFKFSPDGKFVAYRVKGASNDYKLWLWQAPGWVAEQEVPLSGSVTHYEWSKDSGVLAAAIKTTDDTLLGGVKVTAVPDVATAGPIQGLSILTPVSAPVDSDITWYGDDTNQYVAFHSEWMASPSDRMTGSATLGLRGFENVLSNPEVQYTEWVSLQPSPDGYFVSDEIYGLLNYNQNGGTSPILHGNEAVAPSGKYTALSDGTKLELYRAFDESGMPGTSAVASANECANLLTWSKRQERLVCVGTSENSLWSHTLDSLGTSFASAPVSDSSAYTSGVWNGYRRSISSSGNWLALTTPDHVYMASLAGNAPQVLWPYAFLSGSVGTNVSFAPAEDLVVVQRDKALWLFNVSAIGTGNQFLGEVSDSVAPCQEEWLSSPTWCGSDTQTENLVWSPDSRLVALVQGTQELIIQDLRLWPTASKMTTISVATNCGLGCIGGIRFQP